MATTRNATKVHLPIEIFSTLVVATRDGDRRICTGGGLATFLRRERGLIFENEEFDEAINQLVKDNKIRMEGVGRLTPIFVPITD